MLRRRWTAGLYYAGLILLTLFIPAAIIIGTWNRGNESFYGVIAGIIAFLIFLAYLIYPTILGSGGRNE